MLHSATKEVYAICMVSARWYALRMLLQPSTEHGANLYIELGIDLGVALGVDIGVDLGVDLVVDLGVGNPGVVEMLQHTVPPEAAVKPQMVAVVAVEKEAARAVEGAEADRVVAVAAHATNAHAYARERTRSQARAAANTNVPPPPCTKAYRHTLLLHHPKARPAPSRTLFSDTPFRRAGAHSGTRARAPACRQACNRRLSAERTQERKLKAWAFREGQY
eukprot:1583668-Pleurochrysis_carterae.AAC.2